VTASAIRHQTDVTASRPRVAAEFSVAERATGGSTTKSTKKTTR
jgi:hypothetical protein